MESVKKTREQFETYLLKVIDEYIPVLLLQKYTFEVKKGVADKKASFESLYHYPYLNVTIKYAESAFKEWKQGIDLIPYIVHEMCHPITDPLYSKAISRYASREEILDEREMLTDHICNIVLKRGK